MNDEQKIASKKIVLSLDQRTFQYLEVLAVGLNREICGDDELLNGHDNKNDDFAPLVSRLLEGVAVSLADGVRRPGSWERGIVDSLTGWDGTVNKGMFGPSINVSETE